MLTFIKFLLLFLAISQCDARGRNRKAKPFLDEAQSNEDGKHREGKLFSLFNIVQFENRGCRSTSSISSGGTGTGTTTRRGTCFTNRECVDKSGTAEGSCAAGFGVCCVFLVETSGTTVNENCTYIRNPGYPNSYPDTNAVQHTIAKSSNNVCRLRLDFENFNILGTGNTAEVDDVTLDPPLAAGGICRDTFDITTNTASRRIPQICGLNTGQHLYVDIGLLPGDTVQLAFAFAGTSNTRQWEIKVSQIPCHSECSKDYNPPDGCLQYHTGLTGRFTTFNFLPTNDNHLQNQDYSVCIRQEEGHCCVQYFPCPDVDNPFTLDTQALADGPLMAEHDTSCATGDYIAIDGASASCSCQGSPLPVVNKFCGDTLSAVEMAEAPTPVCDCSQPFIVDIFTDNLDDQGGGTATLAPNVSPSRGVCLIYKQIACD